MRQSWSISAFLALLALARCFASECAPSKLGPQETKSRLQQLEKKAQGQFQRREFAGAAESLREAACLASKDAHFHYALGLAEAAAGHLTRARQALGKADRLDPLNPQPLVMIVKVSLEMGEIDKVKQSLRAAASRFPQNAQMHAELTRELIQHVQHDLALAEALRFEQSGQSDPEGILTLAVLENAAGAHRDAIRHAVVLEDQSTLSERVRASAAGIAGLSYYSLGEPEEAAQHLKLSIQLAPSLEDSYLVLAKTFQEAQKYKAAAEVLEQGRKYTLGSPKLLLALGSNLVAAGEYRAGSRILMELTQRFPNELEAYKQLAEAHRNLGEAEQATQALRKLGELKPDYPMLHVMIAQSMLAENSADHSKVLEELVQAEKASPRDPDIYYLRAKIYASMNRYPEAVAALRRAIELRPTDARPYYQLGLTYEKVGRPELAKEQFERMKYLKGGPPAP